MLRRLTVSHATASVSLLVLRQRALRRVASFPDMRHQPFLRNQVVSVQIPQPAHRFGERFGGPFQMIEKSGSFGTTHKYHRY